jgi:hypothetical protein
MVVEPRDSPVVAAVVSMVGTCDCSSSDSLAEVTFNTVVSRVVSVIRSSVPDYAGYLAGGKSRSAHLQRVITDRQQSGRKSSRRIGPGLAQHLPGRLIDHIYFRARNYRARCVLNRTGNGASSPTLRQRQPAEAHHGNQQPPTSQSAP